MGHQDSRFIPSLIKSLSAHKIARVACGAHHSAAVTGKNKLLPPPTNPLMAHFIFYLDQGKLFTWGYNEHGQLGLETTRRIVTEPVQVTTFVVPTKKETNGKA